MRYAACVLLGTLCAIAQAEPQVEIDEYITTAAKPEMPKLQMMQPGQQDWPAGAPLWQGASKGISAKLWGAQSADALRFRILVQDPKHDNPYHERNLWRGDSVYLSIDGRGNDRGVAGEAVQADDAVYLFGLGDKGPEARVLTHGNPVELSLDQSQLLRSIVRDDSAGTTTYDISIPLTKLSTAPLQTPTIGLALNVAHKDEDGADLSWGKMTATAETGRQLNGIALATVPGPMITIAPLKTRLTDPAQMAEATIAIAGETMAMASATVGLVDDAGQFRIQTTMALDTTTGKDGVARYVVTVPSAAITADAARLQVSVTGSGEAVQAQFDLLTPQVAMERFRRHIERLAGSADQDLLREHLQSTLRVVADAYGRLPLEAADHPERADEFLRHVELITSKLPVSALRYDDYVRKCIPLVFAFSSESDRTLQYYSLQLPFDYTPGKAYPLTVYFHGAGDQNPLGFLTTSFDNTHQDTLFRTEVIDPAAVPATHRGLVLIPWGRGNSMFTSYAEDDFWQVMDVVRKRFTIDADRIYLTGFSMGCHGAMSIAGRRPDIFAGVNLASGFGSWSDTQKDHLLENLGAMPLAVWIGELDEMLPGAKALEARLKSRQMTYQYKVLERVPHTYPYAEYQANVAYLMGFTRQRPASFTYTADTGEHSGRSGIFMHWPRPDTPDRWPHFSCTVTGQSVTIESRNTLGLSVDLADPQGLGLSGDVKVIWNGQEAYSGPAKRIDLGTEKVREWMRR